MQIFRRISVFVYFLSVVALVAGLVSRAYAEEAVKKPDIDVFTLENGLQVVVVPQRMRASWA